MALERVQGGPGRLVSASQDGKDYLAWVPDPLPPTLEFDSELASRLADAAGAMGELAGTGRNLPNPHLLLSPFLRKEAVLSSRIEGTQATIADVYAYEAAQLPGMPEAGERGGDVREVLNYVDALNRGLEIIQTSNYPISLGLIEELHLHLMRGVRGTEKTPGKFREAQNIIGPRGATIDTATYIPPPVIHMRDSLASLEDYVRRGNSVHRLVRLALVHYQFEAIHPFSDGNGRVGRLLVALLIVHWDLLPLPLLYLSAYFERNRGEYYDRLQAVTERGEWREWVQFFLTGIAEQSVDATARAKRLVDLRETLQDRAAAGRLPALAARLAGRLVEQPVVTIGGAAKLLDVSYHNARRQVHRLMALGILRPLGPRGHNELFIAEEVMAAVDD